MTCEDLGVEPEVEERLGRGGVSSHNTERTLGTFDIGYVGEVEGEGFREHLGRKFDEGLGGGRQLEGWTGTNSLLRSAVELVESRGS